VKRAEQILKDLENEQARSGRSVNVDKLSNNQQGATGGSQLSIFQLDDPVLEQIRDEMLNLDVDNLTPIEALNKLNEIKRIIKGR
jgi:DNA mismatch repair protein MutS